MRYIFFLLRKVPIKTKWVELITAIILSYWTLEPSLWLMSPMGHKVVSTFVLALGCLNFVSKFISWALLTYWHFVFNILNCFEKFCLISGRIIAYQNPTTFAFKGIDNAIDYLNSEYGGNGIRQIFRFKLGNY